jgi:hypothetical protein
MRGLRYASNSSICFKLTADADADADADTALFACR